VHLEADLPKQIVCAECHNSKFEVTLQGPTATANGAVGTYDYTTKTCSNVYCHSGGPQLLIGGGSTQPPVWDPPSTFGCNGCHATPGGPVGTSAWHPNVAPGVQCVICHPGYTNSSANPALHVNRVANVAPSTVGTSCAACHGLATRSTDQLANAAPPKDRHGSSDTSQRGVGAHQSHLNPPAGAISLPVACTECHVAPPTTGPNQLVHVGPAPDSPAKLSWGPLASAKGAVPAYDRATATCTNYCHGQTLTNGGGTITRPVWTIVNGSQDACGTCHGAPPADVSHVFHAGITALTVTCSTCHPPGYAPNSVGPAVVGLHVNGVRDMNTGALPNWNPAIVGPTGWTGTSTGCHGGTRYWTQGTAPAFSCY
jgi:predicted CxxxxCH...CXXCH cytochrome family protein